MSNLSLLLKIATSLNLSHIQPLKMTTLNYTRTIVKISVTYQSWASLQCLVTWLAPSHVYFSRMTSTFRKSQDHSGSVYMNENLTWLVGAMTRASIRHWTTQVVDTRGMLSWLALFCTWNIVWKFCNLYVIATTKWS